LPLPFLGGAKSRAGWHESFCPKAMRVLIADDQKNVGTCLAELVTSCHHEVVEVVGSGLEAIQAYARHQPDVVLMDYSMPKLNGVTACRNILAKDPAARVILVSAWSPSEEMMRVGALAILAKPVHLERLEAALKSAATASTVHRPAAASVP
jgi:two-component system, chemotaxis family, chemotaxis protein CheY